MTTRFLLWDHDGVIVDTEPFFFEATRATLSTLDVELTRERWLSCQAQGTGLARVLSEGGVPDADLREIRRRRDDLYEGLLQDNDVMIEGARDVLEQLAARHRMALVTTSLRRFVDQLHGGSGVLDHFDHVVTSEDCTRHKPHPEPYLRAMDLLGAPAAESVAIEDSPRGLAAAVAAGVRCFVVRSPFMRDEDVSSAHAVLDDIRELPGRIRETA